MNPLYMNKLIVITFSEKVFPFRRIRKNLFSERCMHTNTPALRPDVGKHMVIKNKAEHINEEVIK